MSKKGQFDAALDANLLHSRADSHLLDEMRAGGGALFSPHTKVSFDKNFSRVEFDALQDDDRSFTP